MAGRRDSRHPGVTALKRWVRGEIPQPEAGRLLGHVLLCRRCHGRWAALARGVLDAPLAAPEQPAAAYRRPVSRVLKWAGRLTWTLEDVPLLLVNPEIRRLACEVVLDRVARLRGQEDFKTAEDTALQLDLSVRAHEAALGAEAAGLRCRIWLEIVNLRRARNFLDGAAQAFRRAEDFFAAGAKEPLLAARLLDVGASLYRGLRQFARAESFLLQAQHLYQQEGKPLEAGRVAVKLAITKIYTNQPQQALEVLVHAAPLLREAEPRLLLITAHNIFMALADAGEADTVARLLWTWRTLYERAGTPLDQNRRLGLEAKVAFGQGHPDRGERLFLRNIEGFQKLGLAYDAALAALELAGRLVELGRTAKVLELLDGAVAAFVERHVYRELAVSLSLLRTAVETGQATARLVATFADALRDAEAAAGGRR